MHDSLLKMANGKWKMEKVSALAWEGDGEKLKLGKRMHFAAANNAQTRSVNRIAAGAATLKLDGDGRGKGGEVESRMHLAKRT